MHQTPYFGSALKRISTGVALVLVSVPVVCLLVLVLCLPAGSKAYFAPADEMIKHAEIIALVDITKVSAVSVKGSHWTYSQVADARVEKVIKEVPSEKADAGKMTRSIKLYGGEDFECARCNFVPGHFLVFLRHDGPLLVSSNWHLAIRPLKNGMVEWYTVFGWSPADMQEVPLKDVLNQIKKTLASPDR